MDIIKLNKLLNYSGCDNTPCPECAIANLVGDIRDWIDTPCSDLAVRLAKEMLIDIVKDSDRDMLKQYEIRYLMYEQDEERTVIWVSHSYEEAQITFTNNYEPYKILSIEEAR